MHKISCSIGSLFSGHSILYCSTALELELGGGRKISEFSTIRMLYTVGIQVYIGKLTPFTPPPRKEEWCLLLSMLLLDVFYNSIEVISARLHMIFMLFNTSYPFLAHRGSFGSLSYTVGAKSWLFLYVVSTCVYVRYFGFMPLSFSFFFLFGFCLFMCMHMCLWLCTYSPEILASQLLLDHDLNQALPRWSGVW